MYGPMSGSHHLLVCSVASPAMGHWGTRPRSIFNNFIFSSLWSKPDSTKYCVVGEISWCRCQQLTALSISTALVTKQLLLAIEQLLHPALKFAVSAPWPIFQLCPSSQQILATPLRMFEIRVRPMGRPSVVCHTDWHGHINLYDRSTTTSLCTVGVVFDASARRRSFADAVKVLRFGH